jgi:signal transduction histidine kinase
LDQLSEVRVLAVDDDATDVEIIRRHLETARSPKYLLTHALNAKDALTLLSSQTFDVALIDFRLSGDMTGLDLVKRIGGRNAAIPFIILTGIEDAAIDRESLLAGAYDYIDKMALTRELLDRSIRFSIASYRYESDLRNAMEDARAQASLNRRILAVVGHEMRSPLRSIVGYADYIVGECQDVASKDAALKMRNASLHLQDFLDNLTEFVRLDEGAAALRPDTVNIQQLVSETVEIFEPYARHKGISIKSKFSPDEPILLVADRLRVRQVISNILKNAVTYSDQGEVRLKVCVEGEYLVVRVEDDGVGMSEPRLREILEFDIGRQLPKRELEAGMGIGLSICRRLVNIMGGTLRIESVEGFGTAVEFRLPVDVGALATV